jgi:dihydroorotase
MGKILIKKARVIDSVTQTDKITDILLENNIIKAIDNNLIADDGETKIIEQPGLILGHGLIDLYSHSGEPGFEERETLNTLLAAAEAGGFSQINILPDTIPTIDNPAGVNFLNHKISSLSKKIKVNLWGALTVNLTGEKMTELAELERSGIVGFTNSKTIENLALLRRILEYLKPFKTPIALFANNRQLRGSGVMREGVASIAFGLPGNPVITETTALAAILELVAAVGIPVHLMRISTARGVELIAAAKAKGLPVSASTTWLHLITNTEAIASYDPNLRLEPPLGNPEDQQALIEGVKEGVLEAIAIDHQGYTYEEKTVSFGEAPPGAIGLELALPLLWSKLVTTELISPLQLWQSLSQNPAQILLQNLPSISVGNNPDLVLFNHHEKWQVSPKNLNSLCYNTHLLGQEITGKIVLIDKC